MLVNNTVDGTSNGAKGERNMPGSTAREGARSWPESHHYRPFDKADKTHKECLSLVSLSSKGRAFPPSLLPASVGILMFLSRSPSLPLTVFLSILFLVSPFLRVSSAHGDRVLSLLSSPLRSPRAHARLCLPSVCTCCVSLWHHDPADAINYATASQAQLRRRLVLIISPFGGPLEIFANSRPAGDTTEILRCRPARYDRSRGKRHSRLSLAVVLYH